MRLKIVVVLFSLTFAAAISDAAAIFPIDRASILAGSHFDLKIEFDGIVSEADVRITINGADASRVLGQPMRFVSNEDGSPQSSVKFNRTILQHPGEYEIVATDGRQTQKAGWTVYGTGNAKARNVILFIGDGMSIANRTAARILSKGIVQGKYFGKLSFDDFRSMALIGTSGVDSIVTDSANSMSAYTTGHKSSVNALGVYVSRAKDNLGHPKVETITELVKRKTGKAVGIVTDAEVQDATPAGMVAHTRRRADKPEITEMLFFSGADVIMGGGSAYFLPQKTPGSKRRDDNDFVGLFRNDGFAVATAAEEMKQAATSPSTRKLLGLFHPENMDGALDRHFLKKGTVDKYPNQPDLVDMTAAAIDVLSRNKEGFVLMVEAGLIDKFSHPLDWERSVYDTIMLSNAVQVAKKFAAKRNDTLILVAPDHTHGMSIVGTIDDAKPGEEMRGKVGVYADAGYPNYPAPNKDGYPEDPNPSRRLAVFYADYPDYYETFHPHLDGPNVPAVKDAGGKYVANPVYEKKAGAMLRPGNLPRSADTGVHTVDDGVLQAMGPGSSMVKGFMDNTEVFRVMADALGLGTLARPQAAKKKAQ